MRFDLLTGDREILKIIWFIVIPAKGWLSRANTVMKDNLIPTAFACDTGDWVRQQWQQKLQCCTTCAHTHKYNTHQSSHPPSTWNEIPLASIGLGMAAEASSVAPQQIKLTLPAWLDTIACKTILTFLGGEIYNLHVWKTWHFKVQAGNKWVNNLMSQQMSNSL